MPTIVASATALIALLVAASPQSRARSGASTRLAFDPDALAAQGIPRDILMWYESAARTCPGLPWPVLAGIIGKVESDHGHSAAPGVHVDPLDLGDVVTTPPADLTAHS